MAEHPNPTILTPQEIRFATQNIRFSNIEKAKAAESKIIESHEALRSERDALLAENTDLWEYVDAMEAVNLAMDNGVATTVEQVARINRAQEVLKKPAAVEHQNQPTP